MAIKDNFLKEVKIGDRVELGINGFKPMAGLIVSLDLDTVRLRMNNDKERVISLDSISIYGVNKDESDPIVTDPIQSFEEEKMLPKEPTSPVSETEKNPSKGPDDFFSELKYRGDTFFKNMSSPIVRNYMDVAKSEKSSILLSIANSLDYGIKHDHENSPADYKIQENITKLKRLIKNDHNKAATSMLGALYYECKSDRLALETYRDSDDNESAFAIAENIQQIIWNCLPVVI